MAFRDELTGLPGRRALDERLRALGRTLRAGDGRRRPLQEVQRHPRPRHRRPGAEARRGAARRASAAAGSPSATAARSSPCSSRAGTRTTRCRTSSRCARTSRAYRMALRAPDRPKRTRKGKRRAARAGGTKHLSVTVDRRRGAHAALRQPAEVIKAADEALYRAKRAGTEPRRRRVTPAAAPPLRGEPATRS